MKSRKAFTLVELVVVIGILAIGSTMAISLAASLSSIQSTTSDQNKKNNELSSVNQMCSDFFSFVSVRNDEFSFTYNDCSDKQLSFTYSTYTFNLEYSSAAKLLFISSDYNGTIDYLKFSKSIELKYTKDISFSFKDDIGLFCANVSFGSEIECLSYVVRV